MKFVQHSVIPVNFSGVSGEGGLVVKRVALRCVYFYLFIYFSLV